MGAIMNIVDRVTSIERRIAAIDAEPIYSISSFEQLRNGIAKAPEAIDTIIAKNSERWNVDPNLVKAIIQNESGFNANSTSATGAQGLMQLMPETAASLGVGNAYNPEQNIAGGVRYLRGLLDRFKGDVRLAVAAYNAGPNAIVRYNGVPPYKETENYVASVLASYRRYGS
jgi:soluble lytic murein transglycosylase-like protein